MGDECLYSWSPSGSVAKVLRTTGTASALNLPNTTATGTRLALTKKDVRTLAKAMDSENIPEMGRVLVLPSEMYYELFDDSELLSIERMNN